ncbi:MAG: AAA family ATPase [Deltaproteobacteria bacterium]|jgi:aminoglycoside phosphotransferase family enzyme/predicted kinase|nr:AAA family ATPase [Deltaproteobacteria bacterium]
MEFSSLVAALQNSQIYPEKPAKIELVQTHISAIFFAGEHVYKVKKPVNFGFLDFTTLEKRKYFCQQEVNLNRRLAQEVYLGVVEIRSHQGRVIIGEGPGEVIEYAVKMKRLPQDCMMDQWLAKGAITPEVVERIAAKIARFHTRAATSPEISKFGNIQTIRGNLEENFSQTEKYVGRVLTPDLYREIIGATRRFLEHHLPLFQKRIVDGKIRDCHGDLHLQHICLGEEILIFDCIEFNRRFRYSDVAADIAFLLMDLDYHQQPPISSDLASHYLRISRDWSLYLLLDFYKSYRAYVRAKVTSFRLEDPNISAQEEASSLGEASRYYRLSHTYAARMNRPMLVITGGLIATGKSTLARSLAEALGWEWLRVDVLRKELAQISPLEHRFEKFHRGIYAPDFSRKTYQTLLDRARILLGGGKSVILDGSFKKQADRTTARDLARETQADFLFIECSSSEEEIHKRLARRAREKNEPSDGRGELLAEQKKDYDPVEGFDCDLYLSLDTEHPPEDCLARIFRHLLEKAGRELASAVQ